MMMMKSAFAALACLVVSACAQCNGITIQTPNPGEQLQPATTAQIRIIPKGNQPPQYDVGLVVTIQPCGNSFGCGLFDPSSLPPAQILWDGPFNSTDSTLMDATVPASLPEGLAMLTATNIQLCGSGLVPTLEVASVMVNITQL